MASNIESFLKLKKRTKKTKTVSVTLQGTEFEFKIQELEPDILSEIQVMNTVAIPSSVRGGPTSEGANPLNLSLDVCLEAIVEPNLKNKELQDHFGVFNERDLLYELFKYDMDSLGDLFTTILELSNSTQAQERETSPDDVKEAKN